MTDLTSSSDQINTARVVRSGATVPEICMHNVKLGQGCFCPQCPSAAYDSSQSGARASNERLSADDAHDWKKCEQLDRIYRQAYDEFAGPIGYRHAVNFDTYKRAGLIAVWNAAQDAMRGSSETCAICDEEFIGHRYGALGHDWRPKPIPHTQKASEGRS